MVGQFDQLIAVGTSCRLRRVAVKLVKAVGGWMGEVRAVKTVQRGGGAGQRPSRFER